MESVVSQIPRGQSVTPRYEIDSEFITIDGQKKYYAQLGMISQGVSQKTEVGKTHQRRRPDRYPVGPGQSAPTRISKALSENRDVGYKDSTTLSERSWFRNRRRYDQRFHDD